MKITKIDGHTYQFSDISVKEILDTAVAMGESESGVAIAYICYAIRVRAMQKLRRKGVKEAINRFSEIVPTNSIQMSHDVIRSVMAHYEDEMSPNVKRTFNSRFGTRIDLWSPTVSWDAFMKKINKPCDKSRNVKNEQSALRVNILAGILDKDPNAKLENLTVEMTVW